MINFLIRHHHLFQGKLRKDVYDDHTSITGFREQCEQGAGRFGTALEGATVREENIDGIKAEWLTPDGSDPDKMILNVHGGGYVSGSCSDHRGIISKFAKYTGVTNLLYEYRLAPEHPFPAAMDNSVKVYQWLLAKGY
jgi:acetyl esterase/lipase